MRTIAAFLLLAAPFAYADEVHLESGGVLQGIVREEGATVKVEIPAGHVTLSGSMVSSIERKRHLLHDYYDRFEPLRDSKDTKALFELAKWAEKNELTRFVKELAKRILEIDPDHEGAHQLLKHERHGGRWLTFEEARRAEGLVFFRGRWVPKAERDRVLAEEEKARAEERKRREQLAREKEELERKEREQAEKEKAEREKAEREKQEKTAKKGSESDRYRRQSNNNRRIGGDGANTRELLRRLKERQKKASNDADWKIRKDDPNRKR